jgi:hypothetical protein
MYSQKNMNKLIKLFIYIVCIPWLIGVLLANYLGVDISHVSAQYIGILYGLQKAGVNIQAKSIIFMEYLIILPVTSWYFYTFPKINTLEKKSVEKLYKNENTAFQNFIGSFLSFILCLWVLSDPLPGKKLIGLIRWDFTFALVIISVLFIELISICALFSLMKNLLFFLKKQICHFWQKSK